MRGVRTLTPSSGAGEQEKSGGSDPAIDEHSISEFIEPASSSTRLVASARIEFGIVLPSHRRPGAHDIDAQALEVRHVPGRDREIVNGRRSGD